MSQFTSEEEIVRTVDELKYRLKPLLSSSRLAKALNYALNLIIRDYGLDGDQHSFASMPARTGLLELVECGATFCPGSGPFSTQVLRCSKPRSHPYDDDPDHVDTSDPKVTVTWTDEETLRYTRKAP